MVHDNREKVLAGLFYQWHYVWNMAHTDFCPTTQQINKLQASALPSRPSLVVLSSMVGTQHRWLGLMEAKIEVGGGNFNFARQIQMRVQTGPLSCISIWIRMLVLWYLAHDVPGSTKTMAYDGRPSWPQHSAQQQHPTMFTQTHTLLLRTACMPPHQPLPLSITTVHNIFPPPFALNDNNITLSSKRRCASSKQRDW